MKCVSISDAKPNGYCSFSVLIFVLTYVKGEKFIYHAWNDHYMLCGWGIQLYLKVLYVSTFFFFFNIPPSCLSSVSFSCLSSESLKYLQWMDPAPPAAAGKPKMGELVLLCIVTLEPDLLFAASWGRRVRWVTQCGGSWMKSRTTTIVILPVGSKDGHIVFNVLHVLPSLPNGFQITAQCCARLLPF